MDRAAKLAAEARNCIITERAWIRLDRRNAAPQRHLTRQHLMKLAAQIGCPNSEISAAIDQALKDAGTGP